MTETLSLLPPSLEALLDAAARVGGTPRAHLGALGRTVLAPPPGGGELRSDASGLNHDGSPLQWCLSAGPGGAAARLLGDPACTVTDQLARYRAGRANIPALVAATRSEGMRPLLDATLAAHVPADDDWRDEYPDGVLWLAAGVDTPGCGTYVDARRGGPDAAWERIDRWLHDLTGSAAAADVYRGIRQRSRLMCVGVEGTCPDDARAKVYWRMAEATRLDAVGVPAFAAPEFARFVELCVGARRMRLTGVVLCAGVKVATGAFADAKLDLCTCPNCLDYTPDESARVAAAVSEAFGIAPLPLADALETTELAFLGLGVDARGRVRFNAYFKEPTRPSS